MMIAHSTIHMSAPHVLFNRHSALRTDMRISFSEPALKHFIASFITTLSFVPGYVATKAYVSFAFRAFHLLCIFTRCFNYVLTSRKRTKLLQFVKHHCMITLKLFLLLIQFHTQHLFQKIIS